MRFEELYEDNGFYDDEEGFYDGSFYDNEDDFFLDDEDDEYDEDFVPRSRRNVGQRFHRKKTLKDDLWDM